jgi:hypothetical protein
MHDVSCDLCVILHVACIVCRVLREFSPNDSATVIINHTAKNAQFLRDWERYRSSPLYQPSFVLIQAVVFLQRHGGRRRRHGCRPCDPEPLRVRLECFRSSVIVFIDFTFFWRLALIFVFCQFPAATDREAGGASASTPPRNHLSSCSSRRPQVGPQPALLQSVVKFSVRALIKYIGNSFE